MRSYEDVECPTCSAGIGERCWSVRREADGTVVRLHPVEHKHAARWTDSHDRARA